MSTKSIITNKKACYVCGTELNLERHHVVFGTSGRKKSEQYGLTVWLCQEHHRGTSGVHGKNGVDLNQKLKREAQRAFEDVYSHQKWMDVFHKNYL